MKKNNHFPQKIVPTVLVMTLLLGACMTTNETPPANTQSGVQVAESKLARLTNPQVPQDDLQTLAAGNRAFAADLYQQLRTQDGNLIFSPYSISLALAMTYAGAREETAGQMADTLHFMLPEDSLHPAFNALSQYLQSLAQPPTSPQPAPTGEPPKGLQLEIANSLWGQKDFNFQQDFLDLLARNYGAGLRLVDFLNDPETARQLINDWVSQQTHDKIQNLFPQDSIDSKTRLALVNAIYFKASWMQAFNPDKTQQGVFHLKDGGQVTVPMMSSGEAAKYYARDTDYQVVGLPYLGGQSMMVVLLPDEGKFDQVEASLDDQQLNSILNSLDEMAVDLYMPKFKIESQFDLPKTLAALGMPDAFDPNLADFSGMDGSRDLYISQVMHKAFVDVDESGTEAAAATGVAISLSAIQETTTVNVDRPFMFFIYEPGHGTILFAGRVLNPAM
jgi:serpin B